MFEYTDEMLYSSKEGTIMHRWETPIIHKMAEFVCKNGGDIIEFGFGMGISATHIQKQKINSHTICEKDSVVLEKLHEWAKDKPNVRILEGDWYDNVDKMNVYNGIFFDTHMDRHAPDFPAIIPRISTYKTRITWWNNLPERYNEFKLKGTRFEIMDVKPPENSYFNHQQYYMPKYIVPNTK